SRCRPVAPSCQRSQRQPGREPARTRTAQCGLPVAGHVRIGWQWLGQHGARARSIRTEHHPHWRGSTWGESLTSRRTAMGRKRYKPEEIVAKLRQVDVLVSQGQNMVDAIRQIGVSEVTYYRWRQEFGGLKSEQVKRLKDLELENSRLRKAVS